VKGTTRCDILFTCQADVAQQVEQLTRNEQVSGSSPLVGSYFICFCRVIVGIKEGLGENVGPDLH
jgi:hypothetical protein